MISTQSARDVLPKYLDFLSSNFLSIFRIVTLKVHAHIVGSLRHEMPLFFGKKEKKQELIANLGSVDLLSHFTKVECDS